jgi:hypothetical protein
MRLQELKEGKISVWTETKPDAERFLAEMYKAGLTWPSGNPSGKAQAKREYVCGYYSPPLALSYVDDDRGWHSNYALTGKAFKPITVAEFFGDKAKYIMSDKQTAIFRRACMASSPWGEPSANPETKPAKRNEQVVAYYNLDGTVTAVYKKNGAVVESATVKRYYTDKDDLRVATKHALEKMLGEVKPKDYNAIVDRRAALGVSTLVRRRYVNGAYSPDFNRGIAILDAWDAANPAPMKKPVQYKEGDLARVRDDLIVGEEYGGLKLLSGAMSALRGHAVRLLGRTPWGEWSTSSGYGMSEAMFSGIVTPTPPFDKAGRPNYKAGQKVAVKNARDAYVGKIESVALDGHARTYYRVRDNVGDCWSVSPSDVIGLADDA